MTKVNVKEYSKSRPVLSPDMFPKAEIIPFTIKKVSHESFKAEGEDERPRIMLLSEEHGENGLWLNVTSLKAIVARLGDDDDNWIGKTIPLVKVRTTDVQTKQPVVKLWVAGDSDDDAWDTVAPRRPGRPAGAVKVAKRGRK